MTFQSTFSPALRFHATSASRDSFGEQKGFRSQVFMFSNFVIIWNLFVHKVHSLEITEIYENNYKLKKTHGFPLDSHSKIAGSRAHWFQINQSIEKTVFCATFFHNCHAKSVGFRARVFQYTISKKSKHESFLTNVHQIFIQRQLVPEPKPLT